MKNSSLISNLRVLCFIGISAFMLSGCDMDKNLSLCGQLGMCGDEKIEQDALCGHYGTCKKEDGEDDVNGSSSNTTTDSSSQATEE